MNPKISIILPFYNAEETLYRALLSIKNQTFISFECIMVDNNSDDASVDIAKEFAKLDQRFILSSEGQQGVVYASNKGSKLAKGKYIARMDADDECFAERLKLQYNFMESNTDYGAVGGLVQYIAHKQGTDGFAAFVQWANSLITYEQIYNKRFMELPIINPSAMWRKSVAQQYGMYEAGDFPEDYQMWLRWLNAGVKIGKVKQNVIKWYDSEKRLSRSNELYNIESFYKAKSPFLNEYLKKINPHYPKVAVWGAGKISRKRANLLIEYGIDICCYIDITKKRQIDKTVLYYEDIPSKGELFILVYVKQKLMRDRVEAFLQNNSYIEGEDFIFVS